MSRTWWCRQRRLPTGQGNRFYGTVDRRVAQLLMSSMVLADSRTTEENCPPVTHRIELVTGLAAQMTADSTKASSLDSKTIGLVRIAALAAVQAPPAAYPICLGRVGDLGISHSDVGAVLDVIEPILGTARLTHAREAVGLALAEIGPAGPESPPYKTEWRNA